MRGQNDQSRLTFGWVLLVLGALVFVCGLCTSGFQIAGLVNAAVQDAQTGGGVDTGAWQDDGWDWSFDSGGSGSDSGSWDVGGWDWGSDSGSWDDGGWDSGSWDSGGSDSGAW